MTAEFKTRAFKAQAVEVQARRFETNNDDGACLNSLVAWITSLGGTARHNGTDLLIQTNAFGEVLDVGDWVVRMEDGTFHGMKPGIFDRLFVST